MSRLAIVTGGTRGIGAAIARGLKKAGYDVAASYSQNHEGAKKFSAETGINCYAWDVSHYESCAESLQKICSDYGKEIDILVNNAGITRDKMMHRMDPKEWHEVISTNLTSCFNMSRAVISGMRDRGFGRIINISSINGLSGQIGQTNYAAAKAGVIGFTKALSLESAAKGITVNAIAPGYIGTEMVAAIKPDVLEGIVAKIPVGRLGTAEEVAHAVLFLASDNAGFITGETLSVNGGQYLD